MDEPYKASFGNDKKFYVDGPAPGGKCSFYGGMLYPGYRMDTQEETELGAKFANLGFAEGYKRAQEDFKRVLGLAVERKTFA